MEDDVIRDMMVNAKTLQMVGGDYVFLTYNHSYFEGDFWQRVNDMLCFDSSR